MKTKITTLALVAATALGALSLATAPASAKGFGGGFHGGGWKGGGWHGGWHGHRRFGWGYGFYGPSYAYYSDCYFIRRFGALIKVCG